MKRMVSNNALHMDNNYVPINRLGYWNKILIDTRVRCPLDYKVVFDSQELAERSAEKIRKRGDSTMVAYIGRECRKWHVGHTRGRRR